MASLAWKTFIQQMGEKEQGPPDNKTSCVNEQPEPWSEAPRELPLDDKVRTFMSIKTRVLLLQQWMSQLRDIPTNSNYLYTHLVSILCQQQ